MADRLRSTEDIADLTEMFWSPSSSMSVGRGGIEDASCCEAGAAHPHSGATQAALKHVRISKNSWRSTLT